MQSQLIQRFILNKKLKNNVIFENKVFTLIIAHAFANTTGWDSIVAVLGKRAEKTASVKQQFIMTSQS